MRVKYREFNIEATMDEILALFAVPDSDDTDPEDTDQKPTPHNHKELDMGKVKALRRAGWTLKDIAEEMDVSPTTISNKLKQEEQEKE